jgi:DNA-binding NarL/FixJ family response regulator
VTASPQTRVLVVDDDGDLRLAVRETLALHSSLDLVDEAPDATTGLELCRLHRPDLVVLDLGLPDMGGQALIGQIREDCPGTRVVVFSGTHSALAGGTDGMGADAFVQKGQDLAHLIRIIEQVAGQPPLVAALELEQDTLSPPTARRFVDATLRDWGCDPIVDDALLVVSELVTNAVTHAASDARLELRLAPGVLRIEVSDNGTGAPEPQSIDVTRPSGRGLLLVSAMAVAWGIDPIPDGKVVWAELDA